MLEEKPAPKFFETGYEKNIPTARRVRIFEYVLAVGVTLGLALLLRLAVVDFYLIRTPAMQQTLLPGDFVAVGKLGYGIRIGQRPPSFVWAVPAAGRLYAFQQPAGELAVKRCAALSGQTVEIREKAAYVDGEEFFFPPSREERTAVAYPAAYSPRDNSSPYRIPRPGEILKLDSMGLRDQEFSRSIMEQENPRHPLLQETRVLVNGMDSPAFVPPDYIFPAGPGTPDYNRMDWLELQNIINFVRAQDSGTGLVFKRQFMLDGRPLREYTVTNRYAYLIGDSWDQSTDSRFYGPVDIARFRGRPLFTVWSQEEPVPEKNLLNRIRWRRIFNWI
jgi:signal peptidase I